MKNVQISFELFQALVMYHLVENPDYTEVIKKGLQDKMDALIRRELYSKSKTAESKEEREKARKEYLDKRGVPESFRW